MNGPDHRLVTETAFSILRDMEGGLPFLSSKADVMNAAGGKGDATGGDNNEIRGADYLEDLEVIDVGGRRDENPHQYRPGPYRPDEVPDKPSYNVEGTCAAAFNHFIDIKKGPGMFDDYDGYSYNRGSASREEFQLAVDAAIDAKKINPDSFLGHLAAFFLTLIDLKVDEGIVNRIFGSKYVHAPGQSGYRPGVCSRSIERYSFPQDKGIYNSVEAESLARFPVIENALLSPKEAGVRHSVFMPLDNLARYWYEQFINNEKPEALGYVLHAIHDASVPHHAAGYMGNWHLEYENIVGKLLAEGWLNPEKDRQQFIDEVRVLVEQWSRIDSAPPVSLKYQPEDLNKVPAQNWRIDQLVTWLALNAYQAYDEVYQHYRPVREHVAWIAIHFWFDADSARRLTLLATAMSVLVLRKALSLPPIAAKRSALSWLSILLLEDE